MSHTNSTSNYALPQFLSSDKPAWMADINVAFADIDAQMKLNEDAADQANTDIGTVGLNFAAGYSNLSTYDVGDIVTYNKRMYQCDIAVTVPEAFDSGKWSYYRVSDAANTANSAESGVNALNTLVGNTDISAIADGTVTGAIDMLNTKASDLEANDLIAYENISNHTSLADCYTAPCDGYLYLSSDANSNVVAKVYGSTNGTNLFTISSAYDFNAVFIRKGMRIYRSAGTGTFSMLFMKLG